MSDDRPEGLTSSQWAAYQREYGVHAAGAYSFDREYYKQTGSYPSESPLYGTNPASADPRRQAILNLIEHGATEGEREAARAALARLDASYHQDADDEAVRLAQDEQDEADYLDALAHGEA